MIRSTEDWQRSVYDFLLNWILFLLLNVDVSGSLKASWIEGA